MYPVNSAPSRAKRPAIEREEEKAWIRFYQQVGADPVLATEILAHLDTDTELRRRHGALYLCSKQSLHAHKARRDHYRRMSASIRWLTHVLLLSPLAWLSSATGHARRRAGEIAAALQSPIDAEPAVAKLGSLLVDEDIAAAQVAFRNTASQPSGPTNARVDGTQTDTAPGRATGT